MDTRSLFLSLGAMAIGAAALLLPAQAQDSEKPEPKVPVLPRHRPLVELFTSQG